jgi:RHS repeat-associated protein
MTTKQRYNNYRSELGVSSEELGVKETQNYTYDENGNLVYVNVERLRDDGKQTEKIKERKLRWDEENRLMAIDDNGFISNYWYDYAGERVVKEAGGNEGVFVNSVFSGGRTDNSTFTLYVSPYMVVSQGGHYTKHYYIGGERVVSKLGDLDSYGADPRRIEYAGEDVDKVVIDYPNKYKDAQQTVKDNYKDFKVPYLGLDNDDYVNGEGFCCTDKSSKMTALDANIGNGNDDPEKLIFFYHSDHLGSTSYVTNLDGAITQHIEYIPFGEVFIEERNNVWNTPYLFNSKELDEETGLYYYGARYYNPRESVWLSVDPLAEKTGTPYQYCYQNPVKFVDFTGMSADPPSNSLYAGQLYIDNTGVFLGKDGGGWDALRAGGDREIILPEVTTVGAKRNSETYEQVTGNTLISRKFGETPKYQFILPQNFGGWSQDDTGSDGLIWKGCLACHAENGAYHYAAYNSQEHNAGLIGAAILGIGISEIGSIRAAAKGAVNANRLNHIFGKSEHALENLVTKFGSQEVAYNAVQNAANQALKAGKLTPNAKGILPSGDMGNIINVGGMNVRLIGGRVENGQVILS